MNIPGWIPYIQGLKTTLTGAAAALTQRATIKFTSAPVFDDGTQTVVGGVQAITGVGTWDRKSGMVHIKGSGARAIALPDPDPTLQYEGLLITVVDFAGNAAAGNITIGPTAEIANGATLATTLVLNTNNSFARLMWRSAGHWVRL